MTLPRARSEGQDHLELRPGILPQVSESRERPKGAERQGHVGGVAIGSGRQRHDGAGVGQQDADRNGQLPETARPDFAHAEARSRSPLHADCLMPTCVFGLILCYRLRGFCRARNFRGTHHVAGNGVAHFHIVNFKDGPCLLLEGRKCLGIG